MPKKEKIVWSDDGGGRRPSDRERVEEVIRLAIRVLTDPERMRLLPGPFLFDLCENGLPAAQASAAKWSRVRVEQSYSRKKASQ